MLASGVEVSRLRRYEWADHTAPRNGGVSDTVAVLQVCMDIRDELVKLNALLHCPNFTGMPAVLRQVRANTSKPKRRKTP